MPDRGAKYADNKIAYIDRKLRQTYRQAQQDLTKKLSDFNKRFAAKDKEKRKQLADGKISEQQYKQWLSGQVFQKQRFEQQLNQVQQVMYHHNQYAADIVNNSRFDVFAENYYSEAFKANWIIQGIDWSVYNTQAIQRLIEDEPDLLPKWKIDKEKDYKWNGKKVNNIIQQGIIQGEGVEQITKRLCDGLSSTNESRMRMFARTAMTGAQNAGRQVQMQQAADMGIDVDKRWIATMDNRTRDSHRALDGEEVPYNEEFSNGLEYPGDPSGPASEVYNCRCTMQSVYPKYEDRSKKWREDVTIDGEPYEEWKEGRKTESAYFKQIKKEMKAEGEGLETLEDYDNEISRLKKMLDEWDDSKFKNYAESSNAYTMLEDKLEELKDKKMLLRYPDDDVMSKLKKTKYTSVRESERDSNPNYGKAGYNVNCANCVVANEARSRGYDVTAGLANKDIRRYHWDKDGKIITGRGSWTDCFDGIKRENVGATRKAQQIKLIEEKVKKWGNGSRGVVYVAWDRGGGHYFSVSNVNGEVIFTNPQNAKSDARGFFDYSKPSKTDIFRVDNCKLNEYIKKVVVANEAGHKKSD